jgi:hypothetical protein
MSWDLLAIAVVVGITGLAILAIPVIHFIKRAYQWSKLRRYSHTWVPHSTSGIPWRKNTWEV